MPSSAHRSHAGSAHATPDFDWRPHPKSQALINELLAAFMARCPEAANFAARMKQDTGTRFGDWVDSIHVPESEVLAQRLLGVGFSRHPQPGAPNCFQHDGAMFPRIVLEPRPKRNEPAATRVMIKADSVADFVAANRIPDDLPIEGEPMARLRRALAFRTPREGEVGAAELWAVERHGFPAFEIEPVTGDDAVVRLQHLESFRRRARDLHDDDAGFVHLNQIVDRAVAALGIDLACDYFFAAEREYWQRRNHAGQVQKARQDRLGLGWANHDHHTYRSSREYFTDLISLLEKLGCHARERFYAGAEAGWGAQVMEQPVTGITIFADVDMSPEELQGDFSHRPLPVREKLGTVGLWCALHGEAILQAGMHHLECQFDHDALRDQLRSAHINTMAPFTNFAFLRQAFTEGERWPISELRLVRLVQTGRLTAQEAHRFRMEGGALGSHLENLERNDGYKGFNQQGVSAIIAKTDPRKQVALTGA